MKSSELKKLIKSSVKEVFQEEMKDLLLEMVRNQRSSVNEGVTYTQPHNQTPPQPQPQQNEAAPQQSVRDLYANALNETAQPAPKRLQVSPGMDTISDGSKLPEGEVDMSLINELMS